MTDTETTTWDEPNECINVLSMIWNQDKMYELMLFVNISDVCARLVIIVLMFIALRHVVYLLFCVCCFACMWFVCFVNLGLLFVDCSHACCTSLHMVRQFWLLFSLILISLLFSWHQHGGKPKLQCKCKRKCVVHYNAHICSPLTSAHAFFFDLQKSRCKWKGPKRWVWIWFYGQCPLPILTSNDSDTTTNKPMTRTTITITTISHHYQNDNNDNDD